VAARSKSGRWLAGPSGPPIPLASPLASGSASVTGACCDNKTMRFETRTAADIVLISLTLCCIMLYTSQSESLSVRHTVTPHASVRGAPAHTQQRTPRTPRSAPELPHSSAGGARGARRHRPHVPTSPYDNVHTSHAHTEHRIPVRSTLHPYCTLVAACACS
jgi:hypothetical protein